MRGSGSVEGGFDARIGVAIVAPPKAAGHMVHTNLQLIWNMQ